MKCFFHFVSGSKRVYRTVIVTKSTSVRHYPLSISSSEHFRCTEAVSPTRRTDYADLVSQLVAEIASSLKAEPYQSNRRNVERSKRWDKINQRSLG